MDVNTRSFVIANLRSLEDQATRRAATAYWNSDEAEAAAWAARETACRMVITALRSGASLSQIEALLAAEAAVPGNAEEATTTAWPADWSLTARAAAWVSVDWDTPHTATAATYLRPQRKKETRWLLHTRKR